ncbi:RNA polymerase-binding protein DksA [Desulfonema ishimotonii]|uniref:RNA polymerase-binding protein DksA n=1 Tax=Desulfonema ishimotonii TaxID=45657 RepID=A0A401FYP8_9BACT|nr:TraR/DksA C4-type zinc finger protein [Desulfonema ishimotonii]GBC62084.1 RNA polymerase-binding protein DksA [Desulfonema ishimotonii]
MKKKDLIYFKELLTARLEDLECRAEDVAFALRNSGETSADILDQAALNTDRNFMIRIRNREYRLIKKVRKALNKIEKGTYGICELCGDDISVPRLKARPVTSHCIECKNLMEMEEQKHMACCR